MIEVPVSWGELVDKITILRIKSERINDPKKRANVLRELELLTQSLGDKIDDPQVLPLMAQLQTVNETLWDVEDKLRDCEAARDFGPEFVTLARAVYFTNDERAAIKRAVNDALGSAIIEEKSYRPYAV